MTKSKSSTIAIVVLSVLLAAALASTIVLAAFSATKTATTTITFANGIQLTISGEATVDASTTSFSIEKTNLVASGDIVGAVSGTTNLDANVTFTLAPTISGTGFALKAGDPAVSGKIITWTIQKSSEDVATVAVTVGSTASVETTGAVSVPTTANTAAELINKINVSPVSGKTDNDLASLSIAFSNMVITATATTA